MGCAVAVCMATVFLSDSPHTARWYRLLIECDRKGRHIQWYYLAMQLRDQRTGSCRWRIQTQQLECNGTLEKKVTLVSQRIQNRFAGSRVRFAENKYKKTKQDNQKQDLLGYVSCVLVLGAKLSLSGQRLFNRILNQVHDPNLIRTRLEKQGGQCSKKQEGRKLEGRGGAAAVAIVGFACSKCSRDAGALVLRSLARVSNGRVACTTDHGSLTRICRHAFSARVHYGQIL
jgi:hypothetical protein